MLSASCSPPPESALARHSDHTQDNSRACWHSSAGTLPPREQRAEAARARTSTEALMSIAPSPLIGMVGYRVTERRDMLTS